MLITTNHIATAVSTSVVKNVSARDSQKVLALNRLGSTGCGRGVSSVVVAFILLFLAQLGLYFI